MTHPGKINGSKYQHRGGERRSTCLSYVLPSCDERRRQGTRAHERSLITGSATACQPVPSAETRPSTDPASDGTEELYRDAIREHSSRHALGSQAAGIVTGVQHRGCLGLQVRCPGGRRRVHCGSHDGGSQRDVEGDRINDLDHGLRGCAIRRTRGARCTKLRNSTGIGEG